MVDFHQGFPLMTQYFFDVNPGPHSSIRYDYRGRWLQTIEHAQKMAELIAMDLGCTQGGED